MRRAALVLAMVPSATTIFQPVSTTQHASTTQHTIVHLRYARRHMISSNLKCENGKACNVIGFITVAGVVVFFGLCLSERLDGHHAFCISPLQVS